MSGVSFVAHEHHKLHMLFRSYLSNQIAATNMMPSINENKESTIQESAPQQGVLIRGLSDKEMKEEMNKRNQFASKEANLPSTFTLESEGGWSDNDDYSSSEEGDYGTSALSM